MQEKVIDLNDNIYNLTNSYPELIDILKGMGFGAIGNPIVRNTMGRSMTIPLGCQKQGIILADVVGELKNKGFSIKK